MPSTTKKELYIAKSMGQLNEMAELPAKMKTNNTRALVKTADKMLKEAEHSEMLQDEERAYVLYMKYFNVVSYIKKTADYKKQKAFYDDLLGVKNLMSAIEKAENLSANLKERYDQKEAEAVAKKLASLDTEVSTKDEQKDDKGKTDKKPDENGRMEEFEDKNDKKEPETKPTPSGMLTCTQLYTLLQDKDCEVILMDVRPIADYQESRINHKNVISVPAEAVKPGTTVTHIEKALPMDSQSLWKQRGNIDHIVLLDWNSNLSQVKVGTPLNTLKDALFKYDSTVIIRSEPLILEGGYQQWLLHYPVMCINPDFNKLSSSLPETSQSSLLDFDYPDFDETFLKPSAPEPKPAVSASSSANSLNGSLNGDIAGNLPKVDRTIKPKVDRSTKKINVTRIDVTAPKTSISASNSTGSSLYPDVATISAKNSALFRSADSMAGTALNNASSWPQTTPSDQSAKGKGETSASLSRVTNELSEELSALDKLKRQKQEELERMERDHERLRKEAESRMERLKQEEERLSHLEEMRRKEQTDVADLMRLKKNLQQNITEEKKKNDLENQQKQREEESRRKELSKLAEEEEKKKQRQEEVNRLRMERKRKEEDDSNAVKEAQERARQEEEQRAKELKAAEERARLLKQQQEEEKAEKLRLQQEAETRARQSEADRKAKEEAEKLRQERLRQEHEFQKQLEIEREAKLEKQRQLEEIERKEREKQEELKCERERQELERLDREKRRRDEEDRKKAEVAKKQADEKLRLINEARSTPKAVPSPNLLPGWEKQLDRKTNRYFFVNHNDGTTQWEPPDMQGRSKGSTYTTKLKEEPTVQKRGLSRSNSSPNIAQLIQNEERELKMPTVDRASKPVKTPEPALQPVKMPVKRRDFNPVYGHAGPALTGLRNLGNTCYMNSTIQCLNNTSPLVTYLLTDMYLYYINLDYDYGTCAEVTDDFAHVVKALWSSNYRYITPRDFKGVVGRHQPMFAGYEQQDSQEFLTFLLDALHEGLNLVKKKPKIPEQDNDKLTDVYAAQLAWKHHKQQNESIVVDLFQGQLKSSVRCLTCGNSSVTFQAFMYLSLPIPSSTRCSLQDCLRQFSQDEKMTGSSRWMCTRCKCKRDAAKKIEIWKLPRILLIALNRFVFEGQWRNKISANVDFPVRDLNLSNFVRGPESKVYQLYAVSNHFGTLDGGHYTACCKNPVNKNWYKYDDHEVYEISESSIKTSAAYVLYYTSVELTPPHFKQMSS